MPVTINKLATHCRVPARHRSLADVADQLGRHRLGTELSQLIGPALSRQAPVVRIRRLSVKLRLDAAGLTDDRFVSSWARSVAKSLFDALGRSSQGSAGGSSDEVIRYPSVAHFHAAFIRDLLAGRSQGRWEYAEFDHLNSRTPVQAAVDLLLADQQLLVPILTALGTDASLDLLLAKLNDVQLERFFIELARQCPFPSHGGVSPDDLIWAADQCAAVSGRRHSALDSRQFALGLFVRCGTGLSRTPRVIFHSMLALVCLLECPRLLWTFGEEPYASAADVEHAVGRRLPPAVAELLLRLTALARAGRSASAGTSPDAKAAALTALLGRKLELLRPMVPTATAAVDLPQPPWVELDHASLLLLTGAAVRAGWGDLWNDRWVGVRGGTRIVRSLLVRIGQSICGEPFELCRTVDPAALRFAGCQEAPDPAALAGHAESLSREDREFLLIRLAPGSTGASADTVGSLVEALAAHLVLCFGSRLRGFRSAGRLAIERQFLRHPGRIQTTDRTTTVMLAPQPLHVALHISGVDGPVRSAPWLDGRQLEFVLLEH